MNNIEFKEKPTYKKFVDLSHQEFERWTVLGYAGKKGHNQFWWCECSCTKKTIRKVQSSHLRAGLSVSCGCYKIESQTTHNMWKSKEYTIYWCAKSRCENPNDTGFHNYGGRGIQFCFKNFEEFYAELGNMPSNLHTLERLDNNNNYQKGNVKWATRQEQARNRRTNNLIEYNGEIKCIAEWAEVFNSNWHNTYYKFKKEGYIK